MAWGEGRLDCLLLWTAWRLGRQLGQKKNPTGVGVSADSEQDQAAAEARNDPTQDQDNDGQSKQDVCSFVWLRLWP